MSSKPNLEFLALFVCWLLPQIVSSKVELGGFIVLQVLGQSQNPRIFLKLFPVPYSAP